MKTTRNYKGKDVEMLTACATIIENAIANKEFLISKRKIWEDPFFNNLKTRIEKAFADFLGINSTSELRNATLAITQIQQNALNDLAELKIQIEQDFKADKPQLNQILKLLGFTDFYKTAQSKDQESLIQMLYHFNKNLSNDIRSQIIQKGTDQALLDQITTYANNLSTANILQESLKASQKSITEIAIIEFNQIYDEVISIAKISQNFFKGNTNMKDQFSYAKMIKQLNNNSPKSSKEEEDTSQ